MKATSRRTLAGSIVRDEISRQGRTIRGAALDAKMSPSTLNRIVTGGVEPNSAKLRAVEGVLGMPRYLLTYVIEGRVDAIQSISNMDPDLRQVILAELARIAADADEDAYKRAAI